MNTDNTIANLKKVVAIPDNILLSGDQGIGVYHSNLLKFVGAKTGKIFGNLDLKIKTVEKITDLIKIDVANIKEDLNTFHKKYDNDKNEILTTIQEFKDQIGTLEDFTRNFN